MPVRQGPEREEMFNTCPHEPARLAVYLLVNEASVDPHRIEEPLINTNTAEMPAEV